jgi:hypothetical protein
VNCVGVFTVIDFTRPISATRKPGALAVIVRLMLFTAACASSVSPLLNTKPLRSVTTIVDGSVTSTLVANSGEYEPLAFRRNKPPRTGYAYTYSPVLIVAGSKLIPPLVFMSIGRFRTPFGSTPACFAAPAVGVLATASPRPRTSAQVAATIPRRFPIGIPPKLDPAVRLLPWLGPL